MSSLCDGCNLVNYCIFHLMESIIKQNVAIHELHYQHALIYEDLRRPPAKVLSSMQSVLFRSYGGSFHTSLNHLRLERIGESLWSV